MVSLGIKFKRKEERPKTANKLEELGGVLVSESLKANNSSGGRGRRARRGGQNGF